MGQVFSYIWRCIRRPNIVVETETSQNDPHSPLDDQSHYITIEEEEEEEEEFIEEVIQFDPLEQRSHYITIPDECLAQSDVVTEEEEEEVIQEVIQFTPLEQGSHYIVADLKNDSIEQEEEEEEEEEEEVVVEKVIQEVVAMPVKEYGDVGEIVRRIGPYTSMQKILIVGDGDFSFSTSLAVAFGSASNMIATSLNTQEYLTKNYRKFVSHKRELEIRGCRLIHGVDATNMIQHSVLGKLKFDIIIYNFPHTGSFGRSDDDVRKNQNLIRGFVRNAKKMIDEDGEIHITHKTSRFFRQWDIPKIGCDEGLHLIQEIRFKRAMYPGYYTMFGFGGDRYFHCNPSKTYKFGLRPKSI